MAEEEAESTKGIGKAAEESPHRDTLAKLQGYGERRSRIQAA